MGSSPWPDPYFRSADRAIVVGVRFRRLEREVLEAWRGWSRGAPSGRDGRAFCSKHQFRDSYCRGRSPGNGSGAGCPLDDLDPQRYIAAFRRSRLADLPYRGGSGTDRPAPPGSRASAGAGLSSIRRPRCAGPAVFGRLRPGTDERHAGVWRPAIPAGRTRQPRRQLRQAAGPELLLSIDRGVDSSTIPTQRGPERICS